MKTALSKQFQKTLADAGEVPLGFLTFSVKNECFNLDVLSTQDLGEINALFHKIGVTVKMIGNHILIPEQRSRKKKKR